jgi:hypothetical protein
MSRRSPRAAAQLIAARAVLADAHLVDCDPDHHPELF